MFYAQLWKRSTEKGKSTQITGNGYGQGFYSRYKTFSTFSRYVLNNAKHTLGRLNLQESDKYFIKVYLCTEENKYQDESKMTLLYDSE